MVRTLELYYESAYIKEFDATVTSCTEGGDGSFFVSLDRTAFFPEQGGQGCDKGYLVTEDGKEIPVSHVSISDGIITHVTRSALSEGAKVHGAVDFEYRFSKMQQHTGEHIFSGIVHSRFGYDNVGFHLSDSEVTMDYNGLLSEEDIAQIELLVNKAIWADIPVECTFPSDTELENIDYRSKKELSGDIRIVTIPGYDVCACCAPHVARTGEIGLLKVVKTQNYKGGIRVSILCGQRAVDYACKEHRIVEDLVGIFTTSQDQIVTSVDRLRSDIGDLKGQIIGLQDRLLEYELKDIDKELYNVFLLKETSFDQNLMRKTVNTLAAVHPGFCGVFAGDTQSGYRYIIASGTDGMDSRNIQNILRDEFGARGGGNSPMIQGSLNGADIKAVIDRCQEFRG
jgi:alanyl-tRNA synthetase